MAYPELRLHKAGPLVEDLVRTALDPRLADVHALLRLPLRSANITAGGNFAIAEVLFSFIEGVSRVLWPRYGNTYDAFKECMSRHYGAEHVEPGGLSSADLGVTLWENFRNSMQHSLGLSLRQADKQGIAEPVGRLHGLIVFRDTESLSEEEVESLAASDWPARLHRPTVQIFDYRYQILSVEAFYVGTRRLVESVLADEDAMKQAERFLLEYVTATTPEAPTPGANAIYSGATMRAETSAPAFSALHFNYTVDDPESKS